VPTRSPHRRRRPIVAVIGNGRAAAPALEAAEELGRRLVEAGYRLVTGGLSGVMEAASRGAHVAASYREGDVIGFLPGADPAAANPYVDIVVPTNLGYARNILVVAAADAVVAIGGGAGTLTEMAMAWQMQRPVLALRRPGWSERLAGAAVDEQRDDVVQGADTPAEIIALLEQIFDVRP